MSVRGETTFGLGVAGFTISVISGPAIQHRLGAIPVVPAQEQAGPAVPIVTADVSQLHDSSAETLLQELTEKHNQKRIAPIFAITFVIATVLMLSVQLSIWIMLFACLFVYAHAELLRTDYERKLTLLNYGLDTDARARYVNLLNSIHTLANCSRLWQVSSEQQSRDTKYTAGANTLLEKKTVSLRVARLRLSSKQTWQSGNWHSAIRISSSFLIVSSFIKAQKLVQLSTKIYALHCSKLRSSGDVPPDSYVRCSFGFARYRTDLALRKQERRARPPIFE